MCVCVCVCACMTCGQDPPPHNTTILVNHPPVVGANATPPLILTTAVLQGYLPFNFVGPFLGRLKRDR